MSNAIRFAMNVATEIAMMVADATQQAAEAAAVMRDRLRDEVAMLADAFFQVDDGADYKDAAIARQRAVLKAAHAMGVKVVVLVDAYDCPRSWDWDIA